MSVNMNDVGSGDQVRETASDEAITQKRPLRLWMRIVQGVAAVAVLCGALLLASYLMNTKPTAPRAQSVANARLVTTTTLKPGNARVTIQAMGTVMAAREVDITPRVSGQVVEVSKEFAPGGRFATDALILRIDPTDYALIVKQKQSEVSKVEADLRVEQGNQRVAEHEYELLGKTMREMDKELVLRQPQLKAIRANLELAKAELEKAELDLQRTAIRSPMNAIVADRSLELGGQANTNMTMATLIGTDEYWIRVLVPVDDLKWIEVPGSSGGAGSQVVVHDGMAWGQGAAREGRVIRLESGLEPGGRMAQLIVSVSDPLCLKPENTGKPVLLIDAYVSVDIVGKQLSDVVTLDRALLREGDTVWVMNERKQLAMKPVKVVYRGRDEVLISEGIEAGQKVISSELAGATEGMLLRDAEESGTGGEGATAVSGKENGNER